MVLPIGEGPSTTPPPKQSSRPPKQSTSYQTTTPGTRPTTSTQESYDQVLGLLPQAQAPVIERPAFAELFPDRIDPELRKAVIQESKEEQEEQRNADLQIKREARAERILNRRGIQPLQYMTVPGPMGTTQQMPMANPLYEGAKRALLNRWERKDALETESPRERRERQEAGEKPDRPDIQQMTWDQYNALSTAERAAVDFNSALVNAVRQDRKANRQGLYDDVDKTERETYDDTVKRLFGEDGGSKVFAPETVAMLNQLNLEDSSADLDDFLKLKVAITADDMKKIDRWASRVENGAPKAMTDDTGRYTGPAVDDRTQYQIGLVDATTELQQKLAEGAQLLQNWRATAEAARQEDVGFYGGVVDKARTAPGWGVGQWDKRTGAPLNDDAYFQMQFDALADSRGDESYASQVFADVMSSVGDKGLQQFYDYIDARSRQAMDTGDWGGTSARINPNVQYRSPEDFRKFLGLKN